MWVFRLDDKNEERMERLKQNCAENEARLKKVKALSITQHIKPQSR